VTRLARFEFWAAWWLALIVMGVLGPWSGQHGLQVNGVRDEVLVILAVAAAFALCLYAVTRHRVAAIFLLLTGVITLMVASADTKDPLGAFGGPGPNVHPGWGFWTAVVGALGLILTTATLIHPGGRLRHGAAHGLSAFTALGVRSRAQRVTAPDTAAATAALTIPRVIHRIWLGDEQLPAQFVAYGRTWLERHPGWELKLWHEGNLPPDLVRREVLDSERFGAERADLLRYELLWRYGGVYVDTDLECLRSIESLLRGHDFVTSWHNPPRDRVNNAFIASVPGHPLLEQAMREARATEDRAYAKEATGPVFFDSIVQRFADVTRLDSTAIYPRTTHEREQAYALHHETSSWLSRDPIERLEKNLDAMRGRIQALVDRLDATRRELDRIRSTRWWRTRETFLRIVKSGGDR
jgi:hypothetical protein